MPSILPVLAAVAVFTAPAAGAGPMHFLVANDDMSRAYPPSTVTFYSIGADGSLATPMHVSTNGNGIAGGFFGIARILVSSSGPDVCVYASNAQSENIAAFDAGSRKLTGTFGGSHADTRLAREGVGLAANSTHLYATFSGSTNIGTFLIQPGCKLQFVGDVPVQGLKGGLAEGMAVRDNLMVVAYGDGSIESFNLSTGMPVSRGDAQNSTGAQDDHAPDSVDITSDGHYAIFGDSSATAAVQVSDLSSGKLAPTTVYNLGTAWNSSSIHLSPDEKVLYVSNSTGGRVTAAFFDKATGKVRKGCTSAPLKGFYSKFIYIGAVATELTSGAGGLLYVPEFAAEGKSAIGMLRFTNTANGCTLTETANSPVAGNPTSALLSIGVYPPRPF